jgi:ferredoxin/flavodoxin---NADP+ reductase
MTIMKKFTDEEIAYLRGLKAVENVTTNRIIYSGAFKRHFLREYWNGRKPTEIFRDAGLPVVLLGRKRIERCTYRWVRGNENFEPSAGFGGKREEMIPNAEQGTMLALMETRNLLGDLATALNRLERIILVLGNNEREKREETVMRDESEAHEDVGEPGEVE